jgi:hypothetical protein
MNTKLFLAAAAAVLSLGAGAAQADTKADSAITEAKVSFHFGFYGNPYYYQPYQYNPYYGPRCFYNYYGQYVCKYY